jgi:hypothetical protein
MSTPLCALPLQAGCRHPLIPVVPVGHIDTCRLIIVLKRLNDTRQIPFRHKCSIAQLGVGLHYALIEMHAPEEYLVFNGNVQQVMSGPV